ncbi:hypothetical protein ACF061_13120 [Streptomyces sp. NPDC015220]|uniref:hypothetical protein n=1 Tax=Streptomyces sp. NPDC015220 TaxID=3364947 RepID=UPI0036F6E145
MQWLLSAVGAALLGMLTNALYDVMKYGTVRFPGVLRRRHLPAPARSHDVAGDGLDVLVTWSRARRLTPTLIDTVYEGRVARDHVFDTPVWHEQVAANRARGDAGRTAYLTSLSVDHGEHEAARRFTVGIAESEYAEAMATTHLYRTDTELRARMDQALTGTTDAFMAAVPPTSLTACVAVLSREGTFLLLRRSRSVRTFPLQWTVGINETMKYDDEPGAREDLHSLPLRGLKEELGLEAEDVSSLLIGWLGWSRPAASFVTVNIARSRLTAAEIDERRGRCHSSYEHDAAAWWPLRPRTIASVITGGPTPDDSTSWSYLAPLLAGELWRCRGDA